MSVQLIKLLKQLPYLNVLYTGLKASVKGISRVGVADRSVCVGALINTGLQPDGCATRAA